MAAALLVFAATVQSVHAQSSETAIEQTGGPKSADRVIADVRQSLVVVKSSGRDGSDQGIGTGFVISDDGLVATARHVIGDGRPLAVVLPDGSESHVVEVFATSSQLDLAIIRIAHTSLPPLPLGSEADIQQGAEVLALGHPRGLRNSAVKGIISGHQTIESVEMLQLAMSIEPGNSGGPLVDLHGRVLGIVTLKSTLSDNIGFALPVKLLHDLQNDPNPVPIARWETIGALDPRHWKTLFGALWRQRAGRIKVDGTGTSFGGRSLCISRTAPPAGSFELQVTVRLEDESGAAGLVFHSDDDERHYGFYPSNGNLRLTRFNGPDVESWTILHNAPHPAYRKEGWNTLLVKVDEGMFRCFVNDHLVVSSSDDALSTGSVGLATFRGTEAVFRGFRCGEHVGQTEVDPAVTEQLKQLVARMTPDAPPSADLVREFVGHQQHGAAFLKQETERLRQLADRMDQLAKDAHALTVTEELLRTLHLVPSDKQSPEKAEEIAAPAPAIDLARAALLIALLDNDEVDVAAYLDRIQQMADEIRSPLAEDASPAERVTALDDFLFQGNGFRGSQFEYDTKSNSYLNEVIDDREGLPISLSVLYMSLGEKLGLKISGVGLPGHFVVRREAQGENDVTEVIDPFHRGARLSTEEVEGIIRNAGFPLLPHFQQPRRPVEIIERMLNNLLSLAERDRSDAAVLRYLEVLSSIVPDNMEYRAKRLEMRARTGRLDQAIADVNWFIDTNPPGTNLDRLYELRSMLQEQLQSTQGRNALDPVAW